MTHDNESRLKICGLKHPQNIHEVSQLQPDFMGFIFYENSPRFVKDLDSSVLLDLPSSIVKTGVFVNAPYGEIYNKVKKYQLNAVQLHGDEPAELVDQLKQSGLKVIKVFRVKDELPETIENFEGKVDYYLFDTKAKEYGGTGHRFDWSILMGYPYQTPYLLSGGITIDDIDLLNKMNLPGKIGIDVNSKFENGPGLKNIGLLKKLMQKL